MDKDRVKGAINDAAGRAKRQVGEWTGDVNAQVEGAAQQAKGKLQKAWGNAKDTVREAQSEAEQRRETGREAQAANSSAGAHNSR